MLHREKREREGEGERELFVDVLNNIRLKLILNHRIKVNYDVYSKKAARIGAGIKVCVQII